MKAIVNYFKSWRERRLRERCIKYAVKAKHETYLPFVAMDIYKYITKGKLVD
jgi:hypothetical protein